MGATPELVPRVYWCNTNRGAGAGGNSLEQRMHASHFAAAWSFAGHPEGTFNYTVNMRKIRRGHQIFMYARRVGIIGIGRAIESRLELLFPDNSNRLRDYATEGENVEEWRIPVEWIAWDAGNPCVVPPRRGSFLDITRHSQLVLTVQRHFGL